MPTSCSAYNCTNRFKKGSGISFHRFPKDEKRRKLWLNAVRRENWNPGINTFLCSEHFEKEYFYESKGNKIVKPNAVPTIFKFPPHLQKKKVTPRNVQRAHSPDEENPQKSKSVVETFSEHSYAVLNVEKKLENLEIQKKQMQQNIKILKQKVSRKELSLQEKGQLIEELKKRLGEQENEIIDSCFSTVFKEVLAKKPQSGYSAEVRKFCLTLNFYSNKAYCFLREHLTLPHPSTLRRWAEQVDCSPGFTEASLRKIADMAKEKEVLCCLILDEMGLKKQVEWDGKEVVGYCDLGHGCLENDSMDIANSSLVFLVTAINGAWKIPIGYCLVNGLSGSIRASLCTQYILKIEETGAKCIALTCDGHKSNITMFENLGCNLHLKNTVNKFTIPGVSHDIFIILDACHMLKLMRNLLAEKKVIFGPSGAIKWQLIVDLQKLQESEGLHAANRLRRRHIEWFNQKMKVNIAAQTLSHSVANALRYCHENEIAGFEDVEATVNFIENVNDIFDFLNSCHPFQKGSKAAIYKHNEVQSLLFRDKMVDYLKTLKDPTEKRIVEGGRKTAAIGFIIDVLSVCDIAQEYVWSRSGSMKFLLTRKLSQDHLELFFCTIRSRGGHNNNPTPLQFKASYRKALVAQIDTTKGGNCEKGDDDTNMLNPLLPRSLLQTTANTNLRDLNLNFDHDYVCDYEPLSVFCSDIVDYIAGNVVKSAIQRVSCLDCQSLLLLNDDDNPKSLISIKNLGGLRNPHPDFKKLLRIAEKVFRNIFGNEPNPQKGLYSKFLLETLMLSHDTNILKSFDHLFLSTEVSEESHWSKLVKLLLQIYFNIRIHHICRSKTMKAQGPTMRQKFTKLIIFKGQ